MSEKKTGKKTKVLAEFKALEQVEDVGDGAPERYSFVDFLRKRSEKFKDQKLKESRRRKWKARAA